MITDLGLAVLVAAGVVSWFAGWEPWQTICLWGFILLFALRLWQMSGVQDFLGKVEELWRWYIKPTDPNNDGPILLIVATCVWLFGGLFALMLAPFSELAYATLSVSGVACMATVGSALMLFDVVQRKLAFGASMLAWLYISVVLAFLPQMSIGGITVALTALLTYAVVKGANVYMEVGIKKPA